MLQITDYVMRFAPIAVFAAVAATIASAASASSAPSAISWAASISAWRSCGCC
jgi:Na+/H+-dicarboxylate symporter